MTITTSAPLTPAHPSPSYLAILEDLVTAGYTVRTSLDPTRGAHLVWFAGPGGTAGLHGQLSVGARTGRVTRAQLLPRGEGGPVRNLRGASEAHEAIAGALRDIAVLQGDPADRLAALQGDIVPTTAEVDARTAGQPRYGDLVRYHGSMTSRHGVWRLRGPVAYGENHGRIVLVNPDNPRETLMLSLGSTSISPLS